MSQDLGSQSSLPSLEAAFGEAPVTVLSVSSNGANFRRLEKDEVALAQLLLAGPAYVHHNGRGGFSINGQKQDAYLSLERRSGGQVYVTGLRNGAIVRHNKVDQHLSTQLIPLRSDVAVILQDLGVAFQGNVPSYASRTDPTGHYQ